MSEKATRAQHPLSHPELRLKVRVRADSLGHGKIDLLSHVHETGSISAAGRKMGIAYRRAWHLLETLQACFSEPLLTTSRGGGPTGGAEVTPFGLDLIARHRAFDAQMRDAAAEHLDWLQSVQAPEPS
jgi:molybdate transport system regulatory protein